MSQFVEESEETESERENEKGTILFASRLATSATQQVVSCRLSLRFPHHFVNVID